jgi:tetratricopeptide (TPR) repeat protein
MVPEASPPTGEGEGLGREPLSPAKRKRLQKVFEHASKQMSQDNFDYATELLSQCVIGDPGNLSYVQSYLGNLQKKYNNNKKGANFVIQLKERASKAAAKKAAGHGKWMETIRQGLKALTVNPWDVPTLQAMATASEEMGDEDVVLYYLRCALQAKPNDPDVNLQCAEALRERKQYDQAIACLHRVDKVRPNNEQVQKLISACAVEKTIERGGIEQGDPSKRKQAADGPGEVEEVSREEQLRQAIKRKPDEMPNYFELAQIYIDAEEYEKADGVLEQAYEASGHNPDIRERREDVQVRALRLRVTKAEQRLSESGSDEDRMELQSAKETLDQREVEVAEGRVERYPNNLEFKFKLGQRYQIVGRYDDAIRQYQAARNDPRRKGLCMLSLGQCFQKINQGKLAQSHYESAIEDIPDRDAENKKLALYLAGKIAMRLDDLDAAEEHFNELAAMDFAYRDVRELLDKIAQMRDNDGSE